MQAKGQTRNVWQIIVFYILSFCAVIVIGVVISIPLISKNSCRRPGLFLSRATLSNITLMENVSSCVKLNEAVCDCKRDFAGKTCELYNKCKANPCFYGGTCFKCIGNNNTCCHCQLGSTGSYCETDIIDCKNTTCNNDGKCIDGINKYHCNCSPAWSGSNCSFPVNECDSTPCQNGGTCKDFIGLFQCYCLQGYYGKHCQYIYGNFSYNSSVIFAYSLKLPTEFYTEVCVTKGFIYAASLLQDVVSIHRLVLVRHKTISFLNKVDLGRECYVFKMAYDSKSDSLYVSTGIEIMIYSSQLQRKKKSVVDNFYFNI